LAERCSFTVLRVAFLDSIQSFPQAKVKFV
jgi:hypothetical protein